jgi:hypothetical protein
MTVAIRLYLTVICVLIPVRRGSEREKNASEGMGPLESGRKLRETEGRKREVC